MEELIVRRQDDGGLVPPGGDERGALQQALLNQWQVAGYLMVVVGLTLGAYLVGVGAAPWMFAMCVVLVAPMIGAAVATQTRRYRLAAISSLLGAGGYAFSALVCLLMAPAQIGDWPSTPEMLTSITECLLIVPPLLVASRAALEAGRALWHVPSNPRQLGPGADLQPMPRISSGDTAPDRAVHEPPRQVRPIRYAYR